jgi:hypothetical protein
MLAEIEGASMETLKAYAIEQLRGAREELLAISNDELTLERIGEWRTKYWDLALVPASRLPGHAHFCNSFGHVIQAVPSVAPPSVVQDLRKRLVGMVDDNIRGIDATQIVETILEANIKRVRDTKLAALLNEFNAIKETAPNAAGVLFRTILSLTLQERAKIKEPTSALASATDLSPEPSSERRSARMVIQRYSIVRRGSCLGGSSQVDKKIHSTMWLTSPARMRSWLRKTFPTQSIF